MTLETLQISLIKIKTQRSILNLNTEADSSLYRFSRREKIAVQMSLQLDINFHITKNLLNNIKILIVSRERHSLFQRLCNKICEKGYQAIQINVLVDIDFHGTENFLNNIMQVCHIKKNQESQESKFSRIFLIGNPIYTSGNQVM